MDLIIALIIASAITLAAGIGVSMVGRPPDMNRIELRQTSGPWVYPGATAVGDNTYQSGDDPQKITAWYQQKINGAGMTVTSFVVTNTNNNIINNLAGAGSGMEAAIEILKLANENITTIKVKTVPTGVPDAYNLGTEIQIL